MGASRFSDSQAQEEFTSLRLVEDVLRDFVGDEGRNFFHDLRCQLQLGVGKI
jgi:hypothetical protein